MTLQEKEIKYCRLLTASTRVNYESIGSVYCPVLRETVVFNGRGLHHLNYHSKREDLFASGCGW
jgi:hypothetical protein